MKNLSIFEPHIEKHYAYLKTCKSAWSRTPIFKMTAVSEIFQNTSILQLAIQKYIR